MNFVLTFEMTGGNGFKEKKKVAHQMERLIQLFLQERNYGPGLGEFHLVIKLLPPELAAAFPPGQFYRPRKKEVLIAPLVDILQTIECSEEEWKETLCGEILKAVSRFQELGVKNFDQKAFREDLVKFFHQNGWMN
jgi:hypothetical protein